jgi:thioredoxin 2
MTNNIKLVCGQCTTVNQLPEDRLGRTARCGKCKEKLVSGKPVAVAESALTRFIQYSDLPVMVDFWAPWCGPCRIFAPTFQRYAEQNAQTMCCLKINTEEHQQAALKFHIRSIPTLALFENGVEVSRISGVMNDTQLEEWVASNIIKES